MSNIKISDRVASLSPSATLAMSQRSGEMRAAGIDVINMSVGEPDFDTPEFIKQAGIKAIDDNFTRYTPAAGTLALRQAICDKLRNENGLVYTPAQIVCGNGAKQEMSNVVLALINPGDEVLIPTPAWVSYIEMVKLAGGVPVTVDAGVEQDFKVTADQLEAAITPRTRMLILNTPSNPTGSVYSEDELRALADMLARHEQITIVADEIYEHICFGETPYSIARFENVRDRVVIINGVSKAYAMTGWRLGFMAGPTEVAKAVAKLQGQTTSAPSSIAQKAAEAAYTGPQECVADMCDAFRRRRDLIVELARAIPGWVVNEPKGAFYLFPKVDAYIGRRHGDKVLQSSADYVMYLLEEAHVATVDGGAFAAPGYLRLSYALSEEMIREAMRRIADASARLV